MRIVSWNVNSLRARYARVEDYLTSNEPDVLCLQETKCKGDNFPEFDFRVLGYDVCHYGLSQYNGVAIISKSNLEEISAGIENENDPYIGDGRVIRADIEGLTVVSVYAPNGRDVTSEHYEKKLQWYDHFTDYIERLTRAKSDIVIVGDFNIAPSDEDVWDVNDFPLTTHITDKERSKLEALLGMGFVDSFREKYPKDEGFTFWDYRGSDFLANKGMRIDLGLVSSSLSGTINDVRVDRESRMGEKPSDHAALIVEL